MEETKPIIGFTCGSFDLTHAGHYLMFKECKSQCDILYVAVQTDPTIDRPHKNKPVQTIEERRIQVGACRYVDFTTEYTTEAELYDILKELNPDIRFVGADHEGKPFTGDDLPIKVIFNSRDHNYSSSNLRKRVYDSENQRTDPNNTN